MIEEKRKEREKKIERKGREKRERERKKPPSWGVVGVYHTNYLRHNTPKQSKRDCCKKSCLRNARNFCVGSLCAV